MAWRSLRVAVILVALATIPPLVLGSAMIRRGRTSVHQQAVKRFQIEAESRVRTVDEFLDAVRRDLLFLSRSKMLRELATASGAVVNPRDQVVEELLAFSEGRRAFYQVRYIDETGREVLRLNVTDGRADAVDPDELQDKSQRYYVQDALSQAPGHIYVSHMDANIEHGVVEEPRRSMIRFAARVAGLDGEPRGILVLNIDADYIFSLLGTLPTDTEVWIMDGGGGIQGKAAEGQVGQLDGNALIAQLDEVKTAAGSEATGLLPSGHALETKDHLLFAQPTQLVTGGDCWWFVVARTRASIDAPVRSMGTYLLLLVFTVVVLAGAAGIVVARRLLRATAHLEAARGALKAVNANLEAEVERRTGEMRSLERGLMRADKLASIGQLTAGLLHEVGNPLAAIKTKIQVEEEDGLQPEQMRPLLRDIITEVDRLSTFLRSFARFSRHPTASRKPVDANELVRSVVSLLAPELRRRAVEVVVEVDPDAPLIDADADQIRQVLFNLVLNASQFEPRSGTVRVGVRAETPSVGVPPRVRIEVADDGRGIQEEHKPFLFDPFFTTRTDGSGLGLSICQRIVTDHEGTIEVESEFGAGTRVSVCLPVAVLPMPGEQDADPSSSGRISDTVDVEDGSTTES